MAGGRPSQGYDSGLRTEADAVIPNPRYVKILRLIRSDVSRRYPLKWMLRFPCIGSRIGKHILGITGTAVTTSTLNPSNHDCLPATCPIPFRRIRSTISCKGGSKLAPCDQTHEALHRIMHSQTKISVLTQYHITKEGNSFGSRYQKRHSAELSRG